MRATTPYTAELYDELGNQWGMGSCMGMTDTHAVWRFGVLKDSAIAPYFRDGGRDSFVWIIATRDGEQIIERFDGFACQLPQAFRDIMDSEPLGFMPTILSDEHRVVESAKADGKGAAEWYFDRDHPDNHQLVTLLRQIEDGDPMAMDTFLVPSDYFQMCNFREHLESLDITCDDEQESEFWDLYETSFSEAYQDEVVAEIYRRLGGAVPGSPILNLAVYDEGKYVTVEQVYPAAEKPTVLILADEDTDINYRINNEIEG